MKCEFENHILFLPNEKEAVLKCSRAGHTGILTKQNESPTKCPWYVSTQIHLLRELEGTGVLSELKSMTYFHGGCKLLRDTFITDVKS